VLSLAMLFPFLQLLFGVNQATSIKSNSNFVMQWVNNYLGNLIKNGDAFFALGIVCILIVITIFLKNMFLYLSFRTLGPVKNAIANKLRIDMHDKLLQLPIGYFTEQRKGDIMSRMTNDVNEIEGSVIGALEGWIKDPLAIIINLTVLFYISPKLTMFILVCLPIMGFVIGKVSRSLKKQSMKVAEKSGETFSTIEETLGGLRVIKAFNVEQKLRQKFLALSDEFLKARNQVGFRRDMASPMSELMGVSI
jgi:subfamily B ATP-binding cassette protein MsbA